MALFQDFRIRTSEDDFDQKVEWLIENRKNNIRKKAGIDIPDNLFSVEHETRDGERYCRVKYDGQ